MITNRHIIGTKCPMCNNTLDEQSVQGVSVKCTCCGYESLLKSPFDKKRERTIISTHISLFKRAIILSLFCYALFLLPLIGYLLVSEQTLAGMYAAHPVGTVIYSSITLFVLGGYSLLLIFLFALFKKWAGRDYDMDWLIAYCKKHKWVAITVNLNYWKKAIAENK